VGEDGVRLYTFPPLAADSSAIAREQMRRWSNPSQRILVARKMYAWRLGEVLPHEDLNVLRGIEGARLREAYARLAEAYGLQWHGRRYDRSQPGSADAANQAINHVVTAVEACAAIACGVTGAIPQLGFVHEDSGISFILDLADLFRTDVTLPVAFTAVQESEKKPTEPLERIARRLIAKTARRLELIPKMIDRIKELFPCP
jgi:CRISPR-associated protein Cas1